MTHDDKVRLEQPEPAPLEDATVLILEDRDEETLGLMRPTPIDVEIRGERACRPVFEHVPPPAVRRVGRHVVRHDVNQMTEMGLTKSRVQPGEAVFTAQVVA